MTDLENLLADLRDGSPAELVDRAAEALAESSEAVSALADRDDYDTATLWWAAGTLSEAYAAILPSGMAGRGGCVRAGAGAAARGGARAAGDGGERGGAALQTQAAGGTRLDHRARTGSVRAGDYGVCFARRRVMTIAQRTIASCVSWRRS